MSRWLRVAAAQLRSGTDPEENAAAAHAAVREAGARGAALVVLPEATMLSFARNPRRGAQPLDGAFADGVRDAAREVGVTAVVGMFEPAEDERVHNTLLLTGPAGEAAYRKVHLFDAFGSHESETVAPGHRYVTAPVDGGAAGTVEVGLATCFDVRFAAQFTELGRAGAEVVVLPASWGAGPGKVDQWEVLTRARALDTQAWVVAAAQAYQEPMGATPLGVGHSMVVDPLGAVQGRLGDEPGMLVVDIDLDRVGETRSRIPVLSGPGRG